MPATSQKPLKVAVLITNDLTGDSRVLKTCYSAVQNGFEVRAIATISQGLPQIQHQDGYTIIRCGIPSAQSRFSNLTPAVALGYGLKYFHIDIRKLVARGLELRTRNQANLLRPELYSYKPDIVHANDPDTLTLAMEYKQAAKYPVAVVYDSHEYVRGVHRPSKGWNDFMLAEEEKWISQTDGQITVSPSIAELLTRDYKLKVRPAVIANFPTIPTAVSDYSHGTVRSKLSLDPEVPLHVYVGASAQARGIETALRALSLLQKHHLCLVTKMNSFVADMLKLARDLQVGDRFHVVGYVPANYVATFIADATTGISPLLHHQNHELACPTKIYEYLHANLPIISSDVTESKSFIETNNIGRTFTAGDFRACAAVMQEVGEHRENFTKNITQELKDLTSWESQNLALSATYSTAYTNATLSAH